MRQVVFDNKMRVFLHETPYFLEKGVHHAHTQ